MTNDTKKLLYQHVIPFIVIQVITTYTSGIYSAVILTCYLFYVIYTVIKAYKEYKSTIAGFQQITARYAQQELELYRIMRYQPDKAEFNRYNFEVMQYLGKDFFDQQH